MNKIYTIGFTKKKAEDFFSIIEKNQIDLLVDIRLNNSSQLAGFSKYPDIEYFLKRICSINYKHDTTFSPEESTLSKYKKKEIDWKTYEKEFSETMNARNIEDYIFKQYNDYSSVCLLCSEPTSTFCHRRLVAERFKEVFNDIQIINL